MSRSRPYLAVIFGRRRCRRRNGTLEAERVVKDDNTASRSAALCFANAMVVVMGRGVSQRDPL